MHQFHYFDSMNYHEVVVDEIELVFENGDSKTTDDTEMYAPETALTAFLMRRVFFSCKRILCRIVSFIASEREKFSLLYCHFP